MGGVKDLYELTAHDRQMFLNELYTIKAQEEKEARSQEEQINRASKSK